MDEGNVGVLERPMIQDSELLLKQRDELRKEYSKKVEYSELVKKTSGDKLPTNAEELRKGLDAQLERLAKDPEEEDKPDKEGKKKVPDLVLRNLDEEGWESLGLGWNKENRERVKKALKERLGINENQATNALFMLVGEGKTPEEALAVLNDDSKYEKYNPSTEEGEKLINQRLREEMSSRIPGADEERAQKYLYLQDELGIKREDYIMRFVLDTEYSAALHEEYDNQLPKDLYDLAWNIGFSEKNEFGYEGKFPVLQMQAERYKVKDEDGKETGEEKVRGRYVVNQGNLMRWMRAQIYNWYEEFDTDDLTDYFSKIELHKGPLASVHLVTMLFDRNRYFRDETGHYWKRLYDQMLLEPWMMMMIRSYYLEYEKAMVSEEKLAEAYNNVFFLSKLTRKVYGKSMVNMLMTLPVDFEGKDSDTKLGEAWSKMYLAYYSMSDFDELEKVLGKNSDFFKKEGWLEAAKQINSGIAGRTGMPAMGTFLGEREDTFNKAFKSDGTIASKDAFRDFVNIYPSPVTPSTQVALVKQALKNAVEHQIVSKDGNPDSEDVDKEEDMVDEKHIKDDISLNYAWLLAHTWTLFTGTAAKNNFPAVSGHNAETKWLYPEAYRRKYATYGGAGNPYTIPMFKQLSVPLLEGILVENADEEYLVYDEKKGQLVVKKRKLTPMEIIKEMHEESEKWEAQRATLRKQMSELEKDDIEGKKKIQQDLDKIDEYSKTRYKILASDLEFNENAMRNYAQNIVGRAKVIYETIMGGHEIDFDKFTKYDGIFRGVSFDRAEWQKAMQGGLITPLRYLFEANGATQFNMMVRAPVYAGKDEKGKPKWDHKKIALGEAMLGHEIVDIPQFRNTVKDVTAEQWKEMKELGYKKKGIYIIRPDGRHDINWNKVQENKTLVYKQWMLMKLGADLWTHISLHSTDPAYGMEHYMNVLDAIASLSGDVEGSEYDMQGVVINKTFFSKEQMAWLKRISGTTFTRLFTRHFFADIFVGDKRKQEAMFGESLSIILSTIFRGY